MAKVKESEVVPNKKSPVVAAWDVPTWASETLVDDESILYSHVAGGIPADKKQAELKVLLVQFDELNYSSDGCSVTRSPVDLIIGGVRVSIEDALLVSDTIRTAVESATQ